MSEVSNNNPLVEEWSGPYGGVPPFDRIRIEHFRPALAAAVEENLREVDEVAGDMASPTFENTLVALERCGRLLDRVRALGEVWRTTLNSPDFRPIDAEIMVKLAEVEDRVAQNEELFARIRAVSDSPQAKSLPAEDQRLIWYRYTSFVRAGAALDRRAKTRLMQINRRLAELSSLFDQNVLADEAGRFVLLKGEADFEGLPEAERQVAQAAAERLGHSGLGLIANTRSAVEPFLTHSSNRLLREKVWRMFVMRGDNDGPHDNKPVISEMLALRFERANLLGYASHAHWALEREMAKTPERVLELMRRVWPAAVGQVRAELERIRPLAGQDRITQVEPWDYRFYADRVRGSSSGVDWDEVKQHLSLDNLRDGMFWVGKQLFGLEFSPTDVPVYHSDVSAWTVRDSRDGRSVGLFYFDPYARAGKKSGAWMNSYRMQHCIDEPVLPIVSNNCNYLPAPEGRPALISWTDAKTLFHEFGHALHGLLSNVKYPSLSGTAVSRDYVEFPSQLLEHWLTSPEMLRRFAKHHRTGEPLAESTIARLRSAARLGRGFGTTEELASGFVDQKLHTASDHPVDPTTIERAAMDELGMPPEMVMRHRPTHFGHLFSGDHYSAKYYSYLWADVLAADAAEGFEEAGGLYDERSAEALREWVLSRGNSLDTGEAYVRFRGREPDPGALMRKRGFAPG